MSDNKLVKVNKHRKFLNILNEEMPEVYLTEREQKIVDRQLSKLAVGAVSSLILKCKGARCKYRSDCSYASIGKEPEGYQCPIELNLLKQCTESYLDEYQVDPINFTEVQYCAELGEQDVLLRRINIEINEESGSLLMEQEVGVDRNGDTIRQRILSPLFEAKQRIQNNKKRIIKLMVGDRQEKYKKQSALKESTGNDVSSVQASLRKEFEQALLKAKQVNAPAEIIVSPEDLFDDKK